MKTILCFILLIMACQSRPSNEMEAIGQDVLKAHEGIEIMVIPLGKDK